jgi:hypothetical protein
MAIDTSIYGMIQRPQIKSPMDMQAEAYTLRNLGQENELRQQQIATARALEQQRVDELERQKAFREAAGRGATDQELLAADPDGAAKLFKSRNEATKEQRLAESADATRQATQYETQRKRLADLTSVISGVTDEASYFRGIRNAFEMGIIDGAMAEQMASHPFNMDEVKQLGSSLLTMKERIDLQEKIDDAKRKQQEFTATLPGKTAESQSKVMTQAERETNKGLTAAQVAENERAKAQQEFQAAENAKNRSVTMRGQNMTDARTREMTQAARENKPLNEYETRNFGFFDRARHAENVLKGVEESISKKGTIGQIGMKLPNVIQSEENQIFEQAKRQFIAAYLRRDSGAVISPSEIAEADRTLFVQPGDGPEVIKQKRKARETITNSLKVGAGRAPERVDGAQSQSSGNNQEDLSKLSTEELLKRLK